MFDPGCRRRSCLEKKRMSQGRYFLDTGVTSYSLRHITFSITSEWGRDCTGVTPSHAPFGESPRVSFRFSPRERGYRLPGASPRSCGIRHALELMIAHVPYRRTGPPPGHQVPGRRLSARAYATGNARPAVGAASNVAPVCGHNVRVRPVLRNVRPGSRAALPRTCPPRVALTP